MAAISFPRRGACGRDKPKNAKEQATMNNTTKSDGSYLLRLAVAGACAGVMALAATTVSAGECPADKRVADGQGQKPGPTTPRDVKDVVRATTDLSKEPANINGRLFRLRQLDMKPGAIVPWHSHNDRPAMIYIVSGEVVERCGAGEKGHLALVAEPRQDARSADLRRFVPDGNERRPDDDVTSGTFPRKRLLQVHISRSPEGVRRTYSGKKHRASKARWFIRVYFPGIRP
jgi:quercetin dioxygenase-like cupin family protein